MIWMTRDVWVLYLLIICWNSRTSRQIGAKMTLLRKWTKMCLLLENLWSLEAKRRAKISRRRQVAFSQSMPSKTKIQLCRKKRPSKIQQVKVQMPDFYLTTCPDRWLDRPNLLHRPTNLPLTSFSKTQKTLQKNYAHKSWLRTRIKICCRKEFSKHKTR